MKYPFRQLLAALVLVPISAASPAGAAESQWIADHASRFRLLLAELPSGVLGGGIEIQMNRGWHTYWRVPGDVGVPPVFDFFRFQQHPVHRCPMARAGKICGYRRGHCPWSISSR